jgi:PST family polysaccharide transporter
MQADSTRQSGLAEESALITSTSAPPAPGRSSSYGQILKASALVGGATALNIVVGIARTKAIALLLGPAGFGLMGLFNLIADLARAVAEMGVNSSGVRQIAEAESSNNRARLARTATVLRRTAMVLGLFGAGLMVALCRPISTLTFGTDQYAGSVALLSLAVLFRLVSEGQGALIQGMRRISDLVKMNVVGAILGAITSITLIYFFNTEGIVPSIIAVAGMSMVTSWWYSRQVNIETTRLKFSEVQLEAGMLLKLGIAFMASGLFMMGATYAVRVMLTRGIGIESAGLYQAAWTLAGLYVGFILQSMGTDFYPRLVGAIDDHEHSNRLVNEQAYVSLLLAGPGVAATLTFSPFVLTWLYSEEFIEAVAVLRWLCLGISLRIITWPIGFIIVAKNKRLIFFSAELAWFCVYVSISWVFIEELGLNGAGIAFFISYIFHGLLVYPIARYLTGFRWSRDNTIEVPKFLFSILIVFTSFLFIPSLWASVIGSIVTIILTAMSVKSLYRIGADNNIGGTLWRLMHRLRLSRFISH